MGKCFRVLSKSEFDTRNIAKKVSSVFHQGDIIILDGDLGVGKTYFVKGFTEGAHSQDLVTSPTFSIANFYRSTNNTLLHIDLYRIETVSEFYDLGLSDYFDRSIVLIEWGEKFSDCFEKYVLISFELLDSGYRRISFRSIGAIDDSKIDIIQKELAELEIC